MGPWEIVAAASLAYSFYNSWPAIVSAPARRASLAGRSEEALAAFARSIPLVPTWNRNSRGILMLQAALAAFDVGKPQEMIDWCERILAIKPPNRNLIMLAHSTAALGYSDLGDNWIGDQHLTSAMEIAEATRNRDQSARFLAQSANGQRKRGALREAIDSAKRALELSPAARREAVVTLAECAAAQGRYDDALRMYDSARGVPAFAIASAERRAQGMYSLGIAATLAEAGRAEIKPHLDHAYVALGSEPKLRIWCDCVALHLRSFDGNRAALAPHRDALEAEAAAFSGDRPTMLWVYSTLPWASIRVGDYEAALGYFDRYQAAKPDPIYEPKTYYGIGLCRRALGNIDGARSAFRLANSRHLDTIHSKLAIDALSELEARMRFGTADLSDARLSAADAESA